MRKNALAFAMAEEEKLSADEIAGAKSRRLDAMALQEIEGNPLMLADTLIFDMFEREGWSHARRHAFLMERVHETAPPSAGPVPPPEH
jgi:hypothetical protein